MASTSVTIDENLEVFNFVRVGSILYLTYSNTFLSDVYIAGNILESYLVYDDFFSMFLMAGLYCIDLLFFVGGTVGAFALMTKLKKVNYDIDEEYYRPYIERLGIILVNSSIFLIFCRLA